MSINALPGITFSAHRTRITAGIACHRCARAANRIGAWVARATSLIEPAYAPYHVAHIFTQFPIAVDIRDIIYMAYTHTIYSCPQHAQTLPGKACDTGGTSTG